ncbi:MAG: NAD-dependent epimerase/dehydratase family protein [Verrucomicrobiae bacterium]|nr:NAD-dependent epimerase/dehydratase family protein [Verrucomicrobiae bacterium]
MTSSAPTPCVIESEEQLLEVLTRPSPALVAEMAGWTGRLVVAGAAGKIGPSLCVMARRAGMAAGRPVEVVAASRFSDPAVRDWLEGQGVRTVRCDLLEPGAESLLPDAERVMSLLGLKFGTDRDPSLTWAVNALGTARLVERYPRAQLVVLSTGNVYPRVPVADGGATEDHGLTPIGEYANAAVARERVVEHLARRQGTPATLLRLSFAVELRYGVLVDIARRVWDGEPIELANGWINWIWQGDGNDWMLRAFPLAEVPPTVWNLTHPQALSVRRIAGWFADAFERPATFHGTEADDALLSNASRLAARFGEPATPVETVLSWIAEWVRRGGRQIGKPTHFEVRDGRY